MSLRDRAEIKGKKAAALGWLYVAGRKVADLESWMWVSNAFTFTVLPATVDPVASRRASCSHILLFYKGQYWAYRVRAGYVADGRVETTWPSFLRLPSHPGNRLPQT